MMPFRRTFIGGAGIGFSSRRSWENWGGKNWVTIDANKDSFMRLERQTRETEVERKVKLVDEERERFEEMEEGKREREERTRRIKEEGETGVAVDFGSKKGIFSSVLQLQSPNVRVCCSMSNSRRYALMHKTPSARDRYR